MTDRILPLLVATALAAASSAQVSVTATALTPIVASASSGAGVFSQSLPAGPLSSGTFLTSGSLGMPGATFYNEFIGDHFRGHYGCRVQAFGGTGVGNSAAIGPCEILVEMQAAQTVYVGMNVIPNHYSVAGSTMPRIDIDVGNNGIAEYINGQQAIPLPPLTVGPQPLQLRLIIDASAVALESVWMQLDIQVEPIRQFNATPVAASCSIYGGGLEALGSFLPNGINLWAPSTPTSPIVMVLGLDTAPQILPSNLGWPCILIPRLDATIPLAGGPGLEFVVPLAVRPLTFYAQTARVEAGQLVVSNGLRLDML